MRLWKKGKMTHLMTGQLSVVAQVEVVCLRTSEGSGGNYFSLLSQKKKKISTWIAFGMTPMIDEGRERKSERDTQTRTFRFRRESLYVSSRSADVRQVWREGCWPSVRHWKREGMYWRREIHITCDQVSFPFFISFFFLNELPPLSVVEKNFLFSKASSGYNETWQMSAIVCYSGVGVGVYTQRYQIVSVKKVKIDDLINMSRTCNIVIR